MYNYKSSCTMRPKIVIFQQHNVVVEQCSSRLMEQRNHIRILEYTQIHNVNEQYHNIDDLDILVVQLCACKLEFCDLVIDV